MSNPFEKYFQATERQNDKINRMTPNWEVPASSPFVPFDTSLDARYSELNKPYTPDPTLKSAGDLLVDAAASALKIPTIIGGVAVGAADLALSAASKPFEWAMDAGHAVRPDLIPEPMDVGIGYIAKGLHDTIGYDPERAKQAIDNAMFSDARKIQEKEYQSGYTAAEDKAFQDSWVNSYQAQVANLQKSGATEQQLKDFNTGFDKQYQEAATKRADKYQTSWDKPLSENIDIIGHGFNNLLENPSLALGGAIESGGYLLPSMLVSRGVLALEKAANVAKIGKVAAAEMAGKSIGELAITRSPFLAAGIGEGSVSGLVTLEQMRSQIPDGIARGRELLGALGVAASTGLIGAGFGKAASQVGIGDIDAAGLGRAASQVAAMKLPALARPVGAVAQESTEEFAQTFGESIIPNVTMGKDPLEGLGQELPLGTLAGAIMGAGMNAPSLVSGGFSDISSGLGKVKEAASLKSFDTLSNPEHKNYNPAQAFNIQLKNLESNDETVRTQAEASVSKLETDLNTARASVEERIKSIQATLKAMPPSDQTTDAQKLEIEALGKEYTDLKTKSDKLTEHLIGFIEAQVTAQEHRDVKQGTQFTEEQAKADIATLTQPIPSQTVWSNQDTDIPVEVIGEPEVDEQGNEFTKVRYTPQEGADPIESYVPTSELVSTQGNNDVAQQEALDRVTRHFSKYSNDDLDLLASSPVLTESQRNSLRVLSKSKRELAAVQDPSQVFDNILNGYKGKTIQESHRGLNQYTDMVNTAVATKNEQLASLALDGLGSFTQDHIAKRDAINEAFGLVQNGTYAEVQTVRTQEGTWGLVPFTAQEVKAGKNAAGANYLSKEALNKVGGLNIHVNSDKPTGGRAVGTITQINNETQLIQDRFNALSGVAESFVGVTPKPVDTSIPPAVDTPVVTESSQRSPRLEEAYKETFSKPIENWDANDFASVGAQATHIDPTFDSKTVDADNAFSQKMAKKIIADGIAKNRSTADIMQDVMFVAYSSDFAMGQSGVAALRAYIELRKAQGTSTTPIVTEPSDTTAPVVTPVPEAPVQSGAMTPEVNQSLEDYIKSLGRTSTDKYKQDLLTTFNAEVDKSISNGYVGGLVGSTKEYNKDKHAVLVAIAASKGYTVGTPIVGNGVYTATLTKSTATPATPVTPTETPVEDVPTSKDEATKALGRLKTTFAIIGTPTVDEVTSEQIKQWKYNSDMGGRRTQSGIDAINADIAKVESYLATKVTKTPTPSQDTTTATSIDSVSIDKLEATVKSFVKVRDITSEEYKQDTATVYEKQWFKVKTAYNNTVRRLVELVSKGVTTVEDVAALTDILNKLYEFAEQTIDLTSDRAALDKLTQRIDSLATALFSDVSPEIIDAYLKGKTESTERRGDKLTTDRDGAKSFDGRTIEYAFNAPHLQETNTPTPVEAEPSIPETVEGLVKEHGYLGELLADEDVPKVVKDVIETVLEVKAGEKRLTSYSRFVGLFAVHGYIEYFTKQAKNDPNIIKLTKAANKLRNLVRLTQHINFLEDYVDSQNNDDLRAYLNKYPELKSIFSELKVKNPTKGTRSLALDVIADFTQVKNLLTTELGKLVQLVGLMYIQAAFEKGQQYLRDTNYADLNEVLSPTVLTLLKGEDIGVLAKNKVLGNDDAVRRNSITDVELTFLDKIDGIPVGELSKEDFETVKALVQNAVNAGFNSYKVVNYTRNEEKISSDIVHNIIVEHLPKEGFTLENFTPEEVIKGAVPQSFIWDFEKKAPETVEDEDAVEESARIQFGRLGRILSNFPYKELHRVPLDKFQAAYKDAHSLAKAAGKASEEAFIAAFKEVEDYLKSRETKTPPTKGIGKDTDEVGFKLTPTGQYTPKDQLKADKATKFIGEGAANSSTAQYAKDAGDKANTGKYTKNDVVFISVNGARANRQAPNLVEIQKAIDAGATILTDKLSDRERSFNVGEREVAAHLTKNGYVEEGNTGVWKPKVKTADTTTPVSEEAEVIPEEEETSTENQVEPSTEAKTIYEKLGSKTATGNVQIKYVLQAAGVAFANSLGGVFSLRVSGVKHHFGNPFSSVAKLLAADPSLIATKSTQESVERYIDWVLNSNNERAKWIRSELQSGALKDKPIIYYAELGEPSHANALDYLINTHVWESQSATPEDEQVSTEPVATEDAKVTVLQNVTDEVAAEERKKPFNLRNILKGYFTQSTTKEDATGANPLVTVADFIRNFNVRTQVGKWLNDRRKPTEKQLAQVEHFQKFHAEFARALKFVFNTTASAIFVSNKENLVGYLEMGKKPSTRELDENVVTALALSAYSYLIKQGNKVMNTNEELETLFRLKKGVRAPFEIEQMFRFAGQEMPIVVKALGTDAAKALGLKVREDQDPTLQDRLNTALGILAMEAMAKAGFIVIDTLEGKPLTDFLTAIKTVRKSKAYTSEDEYDFEVDTDVETEISKFTMVRPNAKMEGEGNSVFKKGIIETKVDGKIVRTETITLNRPVLTEGLPTLNSPLVNELIEANKDTKGFLSYLFGVDVGLTTPLKEIPKKFTQRLINGTDASVPSVQAELLTEAQKHSFTMRTNTVAVFAAMQKLGENSQFLKELLGIWVDAHVLSRTHVTERDSLQAKAQNDWTAVLNGLEWADATLDENGQYQEFYDTQFVAQNQRQHLNSNMFSAQSSQIHRAMAALTGFSTTIDLTKDEQGTVKDEALLNLFYQAVGEGLEGLDDYLKADILAKAEAGLHQFFTVDKVYGDYYVPALKAFLETTESKSAIEAMRALIETGTIDTTQQKAIAAFVDKGKMGAQSLQSLIALAELDIAQDSKEQIFTTTIGFGSDGVNHGVSAANMLTGVISKDMRQQTGIFPIADKGQVQISNMQEVYKRKITDYYVDFGKVMSAKLRDLVGTLVGKLNTDFVQGMTALFPKFEVLDDTGELRNLLDMRKIAKIWAIPFNYSAGKAALQRALARGFLAGIYGNMNKLANKALDIIDAKKKEGITAEQLAALDLKLATVQEQTTTLQDNLNKVLRKYGMSVTLPEPQLLNEEDKGKLSTELENTLMQAAIDLYGEAAWQATEEFAKDYLEVRNVYTEVEKASFTLFDVVRNQLIEEKKASRKYTNVDAKVQVKRETVQYTAEELNAQEAEYFGLTTVEMAEIDAVLAAMRPMFNTALSIGSESTNAADSVTNPSGVSVRKHKMQREPAKGLRAVNTFYLKETDAKGKPFSESRNIGLTKEVEENAGVASSANAIQSIDAFVAAKVQGFMDALNVHDAAIFGLKDFLKGVKKQNEEHLKALTNYQLGLEHAKMLVRVYVGYKAFMATQEEALKSEDVMVKENAQKLITKAKKQMQVLLWGEQMFKGDTALIINNQLVYKGGLIPKLKAAGIVIDDNADIAAAISVFINFALAHDLQKLEVLLDTYSIHQFAGEGGMHQLTKADKASIEKQKALVQKALLDLDTELNGKPAPMNTTEAVKPITELVKFLRKAKGAVIDITSLIEHLTNNTDINDLKARAAQLEVLKAITPLIDETTKVIYSEGDYEGYGYYDEPTNTLHINSAKEAEGGVRSTLAVHELLHAALSRRIKTLRTAIKNNSGEHPEAVAALKRLDALRINLVTPAGMKMLELRAELGSAIEDSVKFYTDQDALIASLKEQVAISLRELQQLNKDKAKPDALAAKAKEWNSLKAELANAQATLAKAGQYLKLRKLLKSKVLSQHTRKDGSISKFTQLDLVNQLENTDEFISHGLTESRLRQVLSKKTVVAAFRGFVKLVGQLLGFSSNQVNALEAFASDTAALLETIGSVTPVVAPNNGERLFSKNTLSGNGLTVARARQILVKHFGEKLIKALEAKGLLRIVETVGDIPSQALKSIQAWHGSPFKFNRFSLAHLGSGEGNQAYGWGLYFAASREVSEWYRTVLSEQQGKHRTHVTYDGIAYEFSEGSEHEAQALIRALVSKGHTFRDSLEALMELRKYPRLVEVRKAFTRIVEGASTRYTEAEIAKEDKFTKEVILKPRRILKILNEMSIDEGQLYKVNLDVIEEGLLLWDTPFEEQSKVVQQALLALGYKPKPKTKYLSLEEDGGSIYRDLAGTLGGQKEASLALKKNGVDGIKYLDGGSRKAGEGNYNYVVFDDAAIDVVETFYSKNPNGIEGYYHNGQATLVAAGLTAKTVVATLLHELIGHKGFQEMMEPAAYNALMKQFNKLVAEGNPIALAALKRAQEATGSDGKPLSLQGQMDEYLPYLLTIQAAINATQAQKSAIAKFIDNVFRAVRAWAYKKLQANGYEGAASTFMQPQDIVYMAERMLREIGNTKGTETSTTDSQLGEVRKKYKGTDQWMKAPNGQPTKLNERQWLQVRTDNFKQWFGDWENDSKNASQVVDENGEPLVVYHGTRTKEKFTEFYTFTAGIFGAGAYFSVRKHEAGGYAKGGKIYEAFINVRKPLSLSDKAFMQNYYTPATQEEAISLGYDAAITTKGAEHKIDYVIAFDPNQIKSAVDNTGAFSPMNPDIRFSKKPPSAEDLVNGQSSLDIMTALPHSNTGAFNQQLDRLIVGEIGQLYNQDDAAKARIDEIQTLTASDALNAGFTLSRKEQYVQQALQYAVAAYMKLHAGGANVGQLRRVYHAAKAKMDVTGKDFHEGDWATATQQEKDIAKAKYDFLFDATKADYMSRFVSMALASESVNKLLDIALPLTKPDTQDKTWFETVSDWVSYVMAWLTNKYVRLNPIAGASNQLSQLMDNLVKLDIRNRQEGVAFHQKAWNTIGLVTTPLNKALKGAGGAVLSGVGLRESRFLPVRALGAILVLRSEEAAKAIPKMIIDMRNNQLPNTKLGEVANILLEASGVGTLRDKFDVLIRQTNLNAKNRQDIVDGVKKAVNKWFKTPLTKAQNKAIAYGLLGTDAQALLENYSVEDIVKMALHEGKLNAEIAKLKKEIAKNPNGNDMLNAAEQLGYYMVTRIGGEGLVKNATGIAIGLGTQYFTPVEQADSKLVSQLNTLVSMLAMTHVPNSDKAILAALYKTDAEGIHATIQLHQGLVNDSLKDFQANPLNMVKGWMPEVTNPYLEIKAANSMVERQQMEAEGWVLIDELKRDKHDKGSPKYLMKHNDIGYQRLVSGAVDLGSTARSGTEAISRTSPKYLGITQARYQNAARRAAIPNGSFDPSKQPRGLIAAYDTDGAPLGYNYEMDNETRDAHLDRKHNIGDLLGTFGGLNYYKPEKAKQSNKVAEVLFEDYKANYSQNPNAYLKISHKSTDPKVVEMWRMLPQDFRQRATELYGKGNPIIIRNEAFNLAFGFKKFSVVSYAFDAVNAERERIKKGLDATGKSPNKFQSAFVGFAEATSNFKSGVIGAVGGTRRSTPQADFAKAEHVTQEIVKAIKDFIVIRSGTTMMWNIFANVLMLMANGINPVTIIKDWVFAVTNVRAYQKLNSQLIQAQADLAGGKDPVALKQKIGALKAELEANVMNPYINAGLLSSIVEDVNIQQGEYTYTSAFKQTVDAKTQWIPKPVKTAAAVLTIAPSTKLYQFLATTTQLSDFVAKYSMSKHLQANGTDINASIIEASKTFINYDVPTSQGLQYANDMGLFMFTKFFLRIQAVLMKLLGKRAGSTIAQHILVESLTGAEGILSPIAYGHIGNNPIESSVFGLPSAFFGIGTIDAVTDFGVSF